MIVILLKMYLLSIICSGRKFCLPFNHTTMSTILLYIYIVYIYYIYIYYTIHSYAITRWYDSTPFIVSKWGVEVLSQSVAVLPWWANAEISFCTILLYGSYCHYSDVIMSAMASQIAGVTIVYPTVCSSTDQRKHKAPRHWSLWGEFTGDHWFPRTKGQ